MFDLLVGSTGFVGGNIIAKHKFSNTCHSSDISEYYGTSPDLCIYAGVPSAMYLANANPEADLEIMKLARKNIKMINPKQLVLISSIAVYQNSIGKNELSIMDEEILSAYGKNRLQLEKWIRKDYPNALIIRLPALYGIGLKKNFIFDLHTIIPSMLNLQKYKELVNKTPLIKESYTLRNNEFYCLNKNYKKVELKEFFINNDFNAISFTDSRSKYQFYNLERLWDDINIALKKSITVINLCTPPVTAKEIYSLVYGDTDWNNELNREPFDYDLHSIYSEELGGKGYYLCSKQEELEDIKRFMISWRD